MEMEDILNKKERQIVYLGASIASGCLPCTKFHLRRSSEAGLTDVENEIKNKSKELEPVETKVKNKKVFLQYQLGTMLHVAWNHLSIIIKQLIILKRINKKV